MKKKVLVSLVLLTFVTVGAAFAQSPTLDKLSFTASGNNYNVKAASNVISGPVVIPDTYNSKPVTQILNNGFMNCGNITSVTIPASVTNVSSNAFQGCTNLTSVTFGGSNTSFSTATNTFPGLSDLKTKYGAGGAGTYTRTAGGTVWTKQAPTLNTSLDGWWIGNSGLTIYIDGNTGYIVHFGTTPVWLDAQKKGYVKTNDQKMRNIRSTGNLTWSMQELAVRFITSNPNVATNTEWDNSTYTMSADGKTLSENGSVIYTRTLAFQ